ncbi:hypothetical protein MKX08_009290 [Trichoderma sp. CBMAI-0020]|nr:hypothetical protein MKX08_009290 [Trichoderma sp. CBMAI-0020]
MWILYFLFNTLTIFWECNIQNPSGSKDDLLVVFRAFNIGMLIIHALIMHACHKLKTWHAEMGSLTDNLASVDREITSHDVFYVNAMAILIAKDLENSGLRSRIIRLENTIKLFAYTYGSGKSTIALLLMRFYDPDNGSILIDNQDIRNFTIQRYGNINATDEQVIHACKTAGLDNDVQAFTQGYKTIIGEQGQNLSGGQTQRIAIARAILRSPKMPILILDEATSALDNTTAWSIIRYLRNLEATKLIVTHNLNIAAALSRIIMINDGRVIADGSHTELLMSSDSYSALWNSEHFPDAPGRQEVPDCDRTI